MPFLASGEYGQWNACVKCILEQLSVCTFTLAHLLHFDKDFRSAGLMTQAKVNPSALNGVLRTNSLRIEDRPF